MARLMPRLMFALLAIVVTAPPVGALPDLSIGRGPYAEWPVASPIRWNVNDHYYEWVDLPSPVTWDQSRDAAAVRTYLGLTGHLATVTSQAEQDALFVLLGGVDALSHHWLGGFQQSSAPGAAEGWRWITGEPWMYTNWGTTAEPDSGGGENGLQMQFGLQGDNPNAGHWNALPRTAAIDFSPLGSYSGYIVEYETSAAVAEAPSLLVLVFDLVAFGGVVWWLRRRGFQF